MKKLYYRTLLTLVVLACTLPFVIRDRDGRPMLQLSELKMPGIAVPGNDALDALVDPLVDKAKVEAGGKDNVTVYRWQDDQGVWHFSDEVNPEGDSEMVQVDVNDNVVDTTHDQAATEAAPVNRAEELLADPLPILHAGEVLDQARNVESVLRQRYQRQEQLLSR